MYAKIAFAIAIGSMTLTACSGSNNQPPSPTTSSSPTATNPGVMAMISSEAFAGTFNGEIPCGDCAGIKTDLTLDADGGYKLNEVFLGRTTNNVLESRGTWRIEDNRHFVLIPSDPGWEQRPFVVLSHNEVSQLNKDGKPYSNDAAYHLKRTAPTGAN